MIYEDCKFSDGIVGGVRLYRHCVDFGLFVVEVNR